MMTNSHGESASHIPLATLSAQHRDLLWVLSQRGPSEILPLMRALTFQYTDHIGHARFCDVLYDLIEHHLVVKQVSDNQLAEYKLTEAGRRALQARRAWQAGVHFDTIERGCE